MNNIYINLIFALLGIGLGAVVIFIRAKAKQSINIEDVQNQFEEKIKQSNTEANLIISEAKERVQHRRESLSNDIDRREGHITKVRQTLEEREENIKKSEDKNRQKELALNSENAFLKSAQDAIENIEKESLKKLSEKTGTTVEGLKEQILSEYKIQLEKENEEKLANIEETLKEEANKRAKKILITIMQRLSSPTSVETRIVHVKVPKDHVKGKILGKNAQNILKLEELLDVDIIFNDIPNTISISAFNLVNRRIAQRAIEKLVKMREEINIRTIERQVERAQKDTEDELYSIGKRAVQKIEIDVDNEDLIKLIGRLQYRTSYGQNIMMHSMEVAWVSTMLGSELGLDVKTCKIGGFLHDLGKSIDQNPDVQGAHDFLTKELMEKYNFKEEEVHAAWTHHDSEPPMTPEALIVKAADAVSASRPGARQNSIEKYAEKIQALEETAASFEGVKNSYSISAGRELRIFVDNEKVQDDNLQKMAESVAQKIEEEIAFPGTIKVKVIRRTQYIEIAK